MQGTICLKNSTRALTTTDYRSVCWPDGAREPIRILPRTATYVDWLAGLARATPSADAGALNLDAYDFIFGKRELVTPLSEQRPRPISIDGALQIQDVGKFFHELQPPADDVHRPR